MGLEGMTILTWPAVGEGPVAASLEDALAAVGTSALVWVDLVKPDDATLSRLDERLGLHMVAAQETGRAFAGSRVREVDGNLFVTWHVVEGRAARAEGARHDLHIILGKGFIVTTAAMRLSVVERASQALLAGEDRLQPEPGWLLHLILDKSVEDCHKLLDAINSDADGLEEAMLANPRQKDLESLLDVKHRLLTLRKTVGREREAASLLAGWQTDLLTKDVTFYFQDLHASLLTFIDDVDTTRDIIAGSMDIYLSSVSNRLNETMKRLTVVATLALPATVITSFFGMNVLLPGRETWLGTGLVLVLLTVITAWLWRYLKRQGWW